MWTLSRLSAFSGFFITASASWALVGNRLLELESRS